MQKNNEKEVCIWVWRIDIVYGIENGGAEVEAMKKQMLSNIPQGMNQNSDIDLSVTGFEEKEINKLIKETEEIITENEEVDILDFSDEKFKCQCPKCGFMFDVNK